MDNQKKIVGDFGEKFTAWYLRIRGYKILARNFHSRFGELDIVAKNRKFIVFVEVKTRTEGSLFAPREAVDYFKQQKCFKTAQYFMLKNPSKLQPRFDVSEIVLKKGTKKPRIAEYTYIKNAF